MVIWEAGTAPEKILRGVLRIILIGNHGLSPLFSLRIKMPSMEYVTIPNDFNLLIGVFAFGLFATDIFVNAGQVVTGHLTPYFLTVCKPNYTSTDCQAHHQFINNGNICTGDLEVIEKARRSFPSKHAALSIYSALYATVSV